MEAYETYQPLVEGGASQSKTDGHLGWRDAAPRGDDAEEEKRGEPEAILLRAASEPGRISPLVSKEGIKHYRRRPTLLRVGTRNASDMFGWMNRFLVSLFSFHLFFFFFFLFLFFVLCFVSLFVSFTSIYIYTNR